MVAVAYPLAWGCCMVRSQVQVHIARPVEAVFAFVVDGFFDNYPRWSPEVVELEALDASQLAPGHRVRQVRIDRGRRSETTVRVTRLQRPDCVELASEHAPWFRIRFEFAAVDADTTAVTFTFELTRVELYMRPFTALIRRAIDAGSERSAGELKRLVETEC